MSFLGAVSLINLFCGIPGVMFFGPILAAINPINPINWVLYIIFLLVVYYVPSVGSVLNSVNGKKSLGRAALWALLFYFILAYFLYLALYFVMCKSAKYVTENEDVSAGLEKYTKFGGTSKTYPKLVPKLIPKVKA